MKDIQLAPYIKDGEAVNISWDPQRPPVEGKQRLLQKIAKMILTQKGTNIWSSSFGNSFYAMMSSPTSGDNDELQSLAPLMINSIKDSILESQLDQDLKPSETLRDLQLVNVNWDSLLKQWFIQISVITQDNLETPLRLP